MTNSDKPVYYTNAPNNCDICKGDFGTVMFDAKTIHGPWANMCTKCWRVITHRHLGTGQGQKYRRTPEGWLKVGG